MSGTLTSDFPSCVIPLGGKSCTVKLSWSTTNPVGISAVTSELDGNGSPTNASGVSYGSIGGYHVSNPDANTGTNVVVNIPYNARNFYLYNSTIMLDSPAGLRITSSCISGAGWDESTNTCSTSGSGMWGPWGPWGLCNIARGADTGTQRRNRSCLVPTCVGPSTETQTCGGSGTDPVNAVCALTHYGCSTGIPADDGASHTSNWTWTCNGINNGASKSCTEQKKKPTIIEN
jgi:hypothetical protein